MTNKTVLNHITTQDEKNIWARTISFLIIILGMGAVMDRWCFIEILSKWGMFFLLVVGAMTANYSTYISNFMTLFHLCS